MEPYLHLALNNAWANRTLYAAIGDMDAETFAAPRPGFFPSLKATLNHIWQVDLYYIDALTEGGQGRGVYDRDPVAAPQDLAAAQAEADAALAAFCRDLTDEGLAATRRTERPGGSVAERVDRLLPHLFQHQIHHRGQAHVQLQDAGIAPPQLDEFFLDHDRAPTAAAYWG